MKLDYKRTVLIGFAFMSILCFWQFYDQVIPYVLENIFGLGTLQANAIMSVDNILALFMLPIFGALSDATKTRWGKRTPYILFGTIASVGINTLVKNKVDLGNTRNLVIASLILTLGIGGAELVFGRITISGIGLSALVGVILNLIIPQPKNN